MAEINKGRNLEYIEMSGKKGSEKWILKYHDGSDSHDFRSLDRATEHLVNAFLKLHDAAMAGAPHLDPQFHKATTIVSLKSDWKSVKRKNVVINFMTKTSTDRIAGRTQKMLADKDIDEKKKGRWPDFALEDFANLEKLAFEYIDGDRSPVQLSLIEKENKNGQQNLDLEKEEFGEKTSDQEEIIEAGLKAGRGRKSA